MRILSYYIKRVQVTDGISRTRYWHNKLGWNASEAKGYSTRGRAKRVLIHLEKKGKAFFDECSIEESHG